MADWWGLQTACRQRCSDLTWLRNGRNWTDFSRSLRLSAPWNASISSSKDVHRPSSASATDLSLGVGDGVDVEAGVSGEASPFSSSPTPTSEKVNWLSRMLSDIDDEVVAAAGASLLLIFVARWGIDTDKEGFGPETHDLVSCAAPKIQYSPTSPALNIPAPPVVILQTRQHPYNKESGNQHVSNTRAT